MLPCKALWEVVLLFLSTAQFRIKSQVMSTAEKFCLKWNDFQKNIGSSFGLMREDTDFADVTLTCEDGQQLEAHKVILAASSPFFQNLLRRNKHAHPLIYMRGMKWEDLVAIVDFLYHGEANIYQENLDAFLVIAEELNLKGLTGGKDTSEIEEPTTIHSKRSSDINEMVKNSPLKNPKRKKELESVPTYNEIKNKVEYTLERAIVLQSTVFSGRIQELDEKIKTMFTTERKEGQSVWTCQVCGKKTKSNTNIRDHIEAHHIEGISLPCNFCEKIFRSRSSLRMHKSSSHI